MNHNAVKFLLRRMINSNAIDAGSTTDEVIATQRRCHKKRMPVFDKTINQVYE